MDAAPIDLRGVIETFPGKSIQNNAYVTQANSCPLVGAAAHERIAFTLR